MDGTERDGIMAAPQFGIVPNCSKTLPPPPLPAPGQILPSSPFPRAHLSMPARNERLLAAAAAVALFSFPTAPVPGNVTSWPRSHAQVRGLLRWVGLDELEVGKGEMGESGPPGMAREHWVGALARWAAADLPLVCICCLDCCCLELRRECCGKVK